MTTLLPTVDATHAAAVLRRWASEAGNRVGTQHAAEAINGYREWVGEALKALLLVLAGASLEELLLTYRYRVLTGAAPADYGVNQLAMLARDELQDQARAFSAAAEELERRKNLWTKRLASETGGGQAHAAVVDTNLLMIAGDRLREQDWNAALEVHRSDPIAIVVPLRVIKELDRHKTSPGSMNLGGKNSIPRRDLARKALIALESMLDGTFSGEPVLLNGEQLEAKTTTRALSLLPLVDEITHQGHADADAEIIDRAQSLVPFAKSVSLLTGDTGMLLQARTAGIRACRPDWVAL